ncbi:MAG: hypothetical protein ACRDTE_29600 [Pseudonocardiaceae bacterium]
MSVSLEIIARAVIIRAGRLLVARDIGAAWCFAAVLIGVVGGDDRGADHQACGTTARRVSLRTDRDQQRGETLRHTERTYVAGHGPAER